MGEGTEPAAGTGPRERGACAVSPGPRLPGRSGVQWCQPRVGCGQGRTAPEGAGGGQVPVLPGFWLVLAVLGAPGLVATTQPSIHCTDLCPSQVVCAGVVARGPWAGGGVGRVLPAEAAAWARARRQDRGADGPTPRAGGAPRPSGDRQQCSASWQRATLYPRAAGPPRHGGRRLWAPQPGAGQQPSVGRARPEHRKKTPPAGPRAWEAHGRCVSSLRGPAKAELRFPELVPGMGRGLPGAGRPMAQLPGCHRNGLLLAEQSSFEPGPYLGLR